MSDNDRIQTQIFPQGHWRATIELLPLSERERAAGGERERGLFFMFFRHVKLSLELMIKIVEPLQSDWRAGSDGTAQPWPQPQPFSLN